MRNLALVVLALAPACKWTDFDDLRDEAWVHASEKPNNDSTNWGVAIARGARSTEGGKLAVVGTAESVYNEIEYRPNGDAKLAANELELNAQFGIGNLEPQPIFLADPVTDDVALITKSGASQVVVLRGTSGDMTPHQVFGAESADAATFLVAPGIDGGTSPQPSQPLIASLNVVFGTFYTPPEQPFIQPRCELRDGGNALAVRGMAGYRFTNMSPTEDVAIWESAGAVYVISGQVFNGARSGIVCPDPSPADTDNTGVLAPAGILAGPLDVGFMPGIGSQVLTFGDRYAILQGHNETAGFLALVDLETMTLVGAPHTEPGLKTAALFESNGQVFVLAGYPTAIVDGVSAGQVLVYAVDPATGIGATPLETLHDAQAEEGQAYGRGVTAMPYNGKTVIAVSGNNEVFVYYRTNLYAETRTGR